MADHRHLAVVGDGPPGDAPPTDGLDGDLALELALPDDAAGWDDDATLYNAVGLRIEIARVVDYDAGDAIYRKGERVACETQSGVAWAVVAVPSRRLLVKGKLPRVLRRGTEGDLDAAAQLRAREQAVWQAGKQATRELGLPARIVRAEALQGGEKFALYFATEDKFSFRDLLHALGQLTRERVELRQIGMRDAAQLVGGVGPCGLQLCCNTFLSDFAPVTMKMAKDQGLPPNPQRVSGVCGRLLCCLVYEEAYYRAQRQLVPRIGERVMTACGAGRVRDVDVLRMQIRVTLDEGQQMIFAVAEIQPLDDKV
jgi:cell fate regulator YaaT (PSP1 superfamily)